MVKSLDEIRNEILNKPKETEIKKINKEIKEQGVKVVYNSNDKWKTMGAWAFIILAVSIAFLVYMIYDDKINLVDMGVLKMPECPPSTLECSSLTCQECPDCAINFSCPNFPNEINVNCNIE